ncbi:MAG: hypothetical protein KAJ01_04915 [Candidatus Hydrogenedentes bacterium]|nr:hypothetical protein [Candidatus Hydrogenedentota bacterium]
MMIPTKEEAQACSDRVAERGHICGGCPGDHYCEVTQKLAIKNPVGARLMQDIILMIATGGRVSSSK